MASVAAKPDFEVIAARSEVERERLWRFRYRVLVEELGGHSIRANLAARTLIDPADATGIQLYVAHRGEPVASLRLNCGDLAGLPEPLVTALRLERFGCWGEAALSMTGRLAVTAAHRDSPALALMLAAAYRLARRSGCRFDFTHVSPALVRLYEQLGYRRYADNFVDEDDSYRVPMVLPLEDFQHLAEINSPFARLARNLDNPRDTALWFARTFPEGAGRLGHRLLDEERFWQFLTDRLHQTPIHALPLLAGLGFEGARRFLAMAGVLRCREGDRVIRRGDIGRELFVLLSGEVAIHRPGGDSPVATLGPGAVFGEMAYLADRPRSADAVAVSDIEVLVLSQQTMRKAMRQMPEVAATVLFNLSLILCERLQAATTGGTPEAVPNVTKLL